PPTSPPPRPSICIQVTDPPPRQPVGDLMHVAVTVTSNSRPPLLTRHCRSRSGGDGGRRPGVRHVVRRALSISLRCRGAGQPDFGYLHPTTSPLHHHLSRATALRPRAGSRLLAAPPA